MISIHPQTPQTPLRTAGRFAVLSAPFVLTSSLLFVPPAAALPKALTPKATTPKALTPKAPAGPAPSGMKTPRGVPVEAVSALARARRWQRAAKSGDVATQARIAVALRQAVDAAPRWSEPRRVMARWHSERRLWNAAAASWRAVLQLRLGDREARAELERARRWTQDLPGLSPWSEQSLVHFGYSLNDETPNANPEHSGSENSGLVTLRSVAQTRPTRDPATDKTVLAPAVPVATTTATEAKPARGVSPDEIRAALGAPSDAPSDGSSGAAVEVTQVPEALNVIQVPDANAAPAALPEAPPGVPDEARSALARARQLARITDYLPEAQAWVGSELQRAVELAPGWTQAQREKARWHTARKEWHEAFVAWTAVLEAQPDDREARAALTRAQRLAVALDQWAGHDLVTLGHDSDNLMASSGELAVTALVAQPAAEAAETPAPVPGASALMVHPAAMLIDASVTLTRVSALVAEAATRPAKIAAALSEAPPTTTEAPPTTAKVSRRLIKAVPLVAEAIRSGSKVQSAAARPAALVTTKAFSQAAPALAPPAETPIPAPVVPAPAPVAAPPAETPAPTPAPAPTDNITLGGSPTPAAAPAATPAPTPKMMPKTAMPKAAMKPKPKAAPKATAKKAAPKRAVHPAAVSKQRQAAAWPWVNRAGNAMKVRNFRAALTYYQKAYALDPNNPYAGLGVPESLSLLKRYPEAINAYNRFLATHPGHSKALHGLANAYAFSGQYDAATRINAQVLAKNPRDFDAALQAAQVMSWAKNYEESKRFYRRALDIQPNNAAAWTEYAEMLSYAHDPGAREAFGRALQFNPESQRAMVGLANLLAWNGEYANAIPLYRGILVRDPSNLMAMIGLGDALTFSDQTALALPVYQKALALSPTSVQARLGLGRALALAHRPDEAIPMLEALLKEQPTNTEALNMLGIAQMANQPGAALVTFQNLLKYEDEPKARAATLANVAELQMKLGQMAEARAAFDEALKLAPTDDKIALSYVRSLMRQELYNDADPLLAAVLARDPANQPALLLQATIAARTDQKERAAALARQIEAMPLEVSDDAINLFYALRAAGETEAGGRLLKRLTEVGAARPEDALKVANAVRDSDQVEASYELYRRILQTNPEFYEAHLELAEALLRRKEFDAAQKEVDAVLSQQPGNVGAKVLGATLAMRRNRTNASYDNAEIVFREALEKNQANTQARMGLAEVLGTRSKFIEAAATYKTVLDADPENLQARLGLARNLYYAKQVPEAIKEYQALLQRAPDDLTLKLELAQVYLDRSMLEDAQRLFLEVLKAANYPVPGTGEITLSQRVPGSGEILADETRRAFREFAMRESARRESARRALQ